MNSSEKGRAGEDFAADFFSRRGYQILARNFRRGRGEIDLILRNGEELIFVEVKHWTSFGVEAMEQAIGTAKAKKIIDAAKVFVVENPDYGTSRLRFDLLFVPSPDEEAVHYQDVFREEMQRPWFG